MKVLLLAGEQSGMIYAEALKKILAGRNVEVRGYQDYGFKISDMAVMGLIPVLKKIGYFMNLKRTMERAIMEWRPDAVCTIDYPGLNLRLAAFAKELGIRAVHVVSPQVWAWKKGRIPKIEASLDKLLCFFPFEPSLYKPGFAEFVGHPLADEIRARACEPDASQTPGARRLVGVLPGSRMGEIERNLPVMLEAVSKLDNVTIEIPAAHSAARKAIEKVIAKAAPRFDRSCCKVLDGKAREVLARSQVAAVASGTATLEAALLGCPTVLVYKAPFLFAAFLRIAIKEIKHVGLANIIWEKMRPGDDSFPMPELLQEDFTADALAGMLEDWLDDSAARAEMTRRLAETCKLLDSNGSAMERIASCVMKG